MTAWGKIIIGWTFCLLQLPQCNGELERKTMLVQTNWYQDSGVQINGESGSLFLEVASCTTAAILGLSDTPGNDYWGVKWEVVLGFWKDPWEDLDGHTTIIRPASYQERSDVQYEQKAFHHHTPELNCNESQEVWLEWDISKISVGYGLIVSQQEYMNYIYTGREHEAPPSWHVKLRAHTSPTKWTLFQNNTETILKIDNEENTNENQFHLQTSTKKGEKKKQKRRRRRRRFKHEKKSISIKISCHLFLLKISSILQWINY